MDKEEFEKLYPSMIRFNLEVTGDEPLPRSTNLCKVGWAGDGKLFVEFFGYTKKDGTVKPTTGYTYEGVPAEVWLDIAGGVQAPDLSDDPLRRSSGRVFYEEIRKQKKYTSYKKEF